MTDNWDFYFMQVDDKPASTYVDLGAVEFAPVAALPFMAYVRLKMNAPRDDGLSSSEEFDALVAVEDVLRVQLVADGSAYVGRCTTNACRDFFFYVARPDGWAARVQEAMRPFANYAFESGTREERDWSTYLDYLYPRESDQQTMQNRRVCESLERHGDTLTAEREIDHWAYFPDAESRDAFVDAAAPLGFRLRNASSPSDEDGRYGAQLWRRDVPSHQAIDGITWPLYERAAAHGGDYDGWESVVLMPA